MAEKIWGAKGPKALPISFYERDTITVAQELLGKLIIARGNPKVPFDHPRAQLTAGRIVEAEAYHGGDPASHSSRGKTPRCAPMFERGGIAYVYFIYGMYEMLNFVTEKKDYPGAVLIRALEPVQGLSLMKRRRKVKKEKDWTNGPGKLSRALGIEMDHNCDPLQGPRIVVAEDDYEIGPILSSPRVGISEGTRQYWRYFLKDNTYVSPCKENKKVRPI